MQEIEEIQTSANQVNIETRTILLYDDIDMATARDISDTLPAMDSMQNSSITIKINSTGGDIFAVVAIISEIERCKNTVVCDITGVAYSGAAMIALACDKTIMSKYGLLMLHYPNWETDSKTLVEHQKDLTVTQEHFERIMSSLLVDTKITLKSFKDKVDTEQYFNPNQCLKAKLVNEVY
jgi:ATP-dependent Clp protease, protease subunit